MGRRPTRASAITVIGVHGFRVDLVDGDTFVVEAETYEVFDEGRLALFGGGAVVEEVAAGAWFEIAEIGQRLSDEWPHSELDHILRASLELMSTFGAMNRLRREDFLDWRFNDLGSFVAAVAATDGVDAESTDHSERRMVEELRVVVARGFGLVEGR